MRATVPSRAPRVPIGRRASLSVPPTLYAATIFYLSAQSAPLPQLTHVVWDKALHMIEYAGLAVLVCRAWRGEGAGWTSAMLVAVLVASAYAGTDEWHQVYVPSRSPDVNDWFADSTGAVSGVIVARLGLRLAARLDQTRCGWLAKF